MFNSVVFATGLAAVIAITTLSLLKFIKPGFEFWPPPSPKSWQHATFRTLFRVFFSVLVILTMVNLQSGSLWRYLVGGALFVIGFGLALRWTGYLGWRDAFGEATGLKTQGPFAWSRNPIYMVSIIGMIGWAIVVGSPHLTILLGLWALLYLGAPLLEEPWLEREFGQAFVDYAKRVPRYFALPKTINQMLSWMELKVPPLLIVLICAGAMYWCAIFLDHAAVLPLVVRLSLATFTAIVAVLVLVAALRAFRQHQTTVNPLEPNRSSTVVTSGIYAYSRNPMYLSMFFLLLGWAVFLGQLAATAGLLLYLAAIARLQIVPEEKILTGKFGDTYADYLASSPRWLGFTGSN